jgi:two-component system cell cycle sensor histidine kinase/response regulator CckA
MSESIRLLMVEDSKDDAELALRLLRRGGYEIVSQCVETPQGFIGALNRESWDLVVCDYSMPQFSGLEALGILRARSTKTPFIFLSGTMGEETAVAALQRGAQDYVMKNNLRRLVPAVGRVLRDAEEGRARDRLQRQVYQLQRFEAIGRLAGGVAHDFNNLLGVISGFAELGTEEAPDIRTKERFQRIYDQAKHGAALTSQLLAFARRQLLQPRYVDINNLITKTLELLGSSLGKDIKIETCLTSDSVVTLADPTQIEQVLMNLLWNARDAMPRGGQIVIATRTVEIEDEFVKTHPYAKRGQYLSIVVSDTGAGMDSATRDRIFEPFFTTKDVGKGPGLGLATVYGIVKQHDGIVEVQSEPGYGTVFQVFLPATAGLVEIAVAAPTKAAPHHAGVNETILFVDDQAELRDLAFHSLRSQGYQIITASDGREGVSLFKENAQIIKAVVLDMTMPVCGGAQAYKEMCAIRSDFAVVFTSGDSAHSQQVHSDLGNDTIFLPKPYSLKALAQAIRQALECQGSLSRKPVAEFSTTHRLTN